MILNAFRLFLLFFVIATPLAGQGRSLDWDQISVDAYLEPDGSLFVEETQLIRMTGDWNVAYRRFQLGWGQKIEVLSLERREATGEWVPLVKGDTFQIHHFEYNWQEHELKWRSRDIMDPPFDNQILVYRIKEI